MEVKVTEYNVRNGAIRWRISTSVRVIRRIFAIALTVSDILMFQMCDLGNLSQVHHSVIMNCNPQEMTEK